MEKKFTNYDRHRLDQLEADIERGLEALDQLTNEEFWVLLAEFDSDLAPKFGDDWPTVRKMLVARRNLL